MNIAEYKYSHKNQNYNVVLFSNKSHTAVVLLKGNQRYLRKNSPCEKILYIGNDIEEASDVFYEYIKPYEERKEHFKKGVKAETPVIEIEAKVDNTKAKKFLGKFLGR